MLTSTGISGLSHVQLQVLADVGEEVVVCVKVGNYLIPVIELVLPVVAVYIVHWRLEGNTQYTHGM